VTTTASRTKTKDPHRRNENEPLLRNLSPVIDICLGYKLPEK